MRNPKQEADKLVRIFKEDIPSVVPYSAQMWWAKVRARVVAEEAEAAIENLKDSGNYYATKEYYVRLKEEIAKI